MKIQVDKDIHIELLVPVFAERLYGLTIHNRVHLKKWLTWLDLVKTFEDTQLFIDTAVNHHSNNQATTFAILYQGELVGVARFNYFDDQPQWGAIGY